MKKEQRKVCDSTCVSESTSYALPEVSHTNTSMIVPVWLSTSSRPDKEVLVYAMLDNQSAATFVLDEVCSEVSVEAEKVSNDPNFQALIVIIIPVVFQMNSYSFSSSLFLQFTAV